MTLSAAALWSTAPMFAQSATKATVPFSFQVANESYEAGHYSIAETNGIVNILNTDSGKRGLFLATPGPDRRGDDSKLVFERIDGRNFLASIDMPDRSSAYRMPSGKLARELKKDHGTLALVRIPLQ